MVSAAVVHTNTIGFLNNPVIMNPVVIGSIEFDSEFFVAGILYVKVFNGSVIRCYADYVISITNTINNRRLIVVPCNINRLIEK